MLDIVEEDVVEDTKQKSFNRAFSFGIMNLGDTYEKDIIFNNQYVYVSK